MSIETPLTSSQPTSKAYAVNIPIPDDGLIAYLVEKGFGDEIFIANDEKIPCVSYLVKTKNETLRKLMEDEKRETEIRICDDVTILGFKLLMRYYGYGKVEIDVNNVSDILIACIYYHELGLVERCKEFLEQSMTVELIQEIFNKVPSSDVLDDLKLLFNDYMIIHGNKLLEDSMLMNNNIEIMKYLLSINNLVVKSENYLMEKLKKFNEEIPKERIIDDEEKNEMTSLYKLVNSEEEVVVKRVYIDTKPTTNEEFNEMFYFYCLSHEIKNKWLKDEKEYKTELKKLDLETFIPELLRNEVILTLTNTVDLINDFNLKYDLKYELLDFLSSKYNDEKLVCYKESYKKGLLLLFELIPFIKYKCSDKQIFDSFDVYLPKYHPLCKGIFNTFKSNNRTLLLGNLMISKARNIPPIYFGYENVNQHVETLPMVIESGFIGDGCEFTINYNDISEIECDKYSGDLFIKQKVNRNYCVTCENDYGFISLDISVNNTTPNTKRISNDMFQRGYKSNRNIKVDKTNKTVNFYTNNVYIVFDEYKKGIYTITITGHYVIISACTTRDNKGEDNKNYEIVRCGNIDTYKVFIDMNNKQLGYYYDNDKKIIHSNIPDSVYFMVESTYGNSYFTYSKVEKTD